MNYRELLKKYIQHVGVTEGTTFIDQTYPDIEGSVLTRTEVEELERLDAEVLAEIKAKQDLIHKPKED